MSDGGRPVEPPTPGGVAVTIAKSEWRGEATIRLEALVSNAADGAPAPLAWTAFSLETDGGALVDADPESGIELCPDGISVAPGASLGCSVEFAVPEGHAPLTLHYRADAERSAQADVEACSPATPGGLCSEHPAQICVAGECAEACYPLAYEFECAACMDEAFESGVCDGAGFVCGEDPGCWDCVSSGSSPICGCAASRECTGCEHEIVTTYVCIARECPACIG